MLIWNPQLQHHLDTFDDKSTTSNDEAQVVVRQECQEGSLQDDDTSAVPEENIVNACLSRRNNEKNQEMNDRLWHPILEWVGMGFLGYYLGTTGSAVGILLVLCPLAAWLFWELSHLDMRRTQQQQQQEDENQFLKCRMELSKLLGLVGAPPLQGSSSPLENANITIHYQLILDFGMAHVSFLRQVDYSLDTLRTAVGMHLRTTLFSVDRVELAGSTLNQCCRHYPDKNVLLPTARRMLFRIILDQYKSLRDCCSSLSTLFDENNDIDNNNNGNNDDSIFQVPEVMTLTSLTSMRHELADLLSFQLSQLMSCQEMLHHLSCLESVLRRQFCASMNQAMELTEYLSCLFSLSPPAIIPESSSDMLQGDLHTLRRQFNNVSVALWACQNLCDSRSSDGGGDGENGGRNTTLSSSGMVLEFLEQMESLLHSVDDVKERLRQDINNKTVNDGETVERNEEMVECCLDKSSTREEHSDPEDYVHSGQSFEENVSSLRNDNTGEHMVKHNKTIVFSASGTMRQLVVGSSKDTVASSSTTLLTIPPRQSIMTQRMVFKELQERLAKMDRAEEEEEVGADGTRILQESDAQSVVQKKRPSTTSSMFLGPSGDVLTELKNSINNNGERWSLSPKG